MTQVYNVSDLIADFLAQAGFDAAFGISSVHNIPLLDAFSRHRGMRFVMARGEMGAAHMADGYSRASGKPGLLITSTGPGAANACSGLLEALVACTPLLHITGQTATAHAGRGRGTTHDAPAQTAMLRAVCKDVFYIDSAERAYEKFAEALTVACTAPFGPVSIEIPIDIQRAPAARDAKLPLFSLPLPEPRAPEASALDALTARVLQARRPMLWVGAGARFAHAEVSGLLALGFGLVTSWSGRGVVSEDHPQVLGALHGVGAPEVEGFYETVDLMLIAGSRLRGQETTEFKLKLPRARVQIDTDSQAEGRTYATEGFVLGDAALTLRALLRRLQDAGYRAATGYAEEFAAMKQSARAAFAKTLGPYEPFPDQLGAVLPPDTIFARDVTVANSTWGHRLFRLHDPRCNIFPIGGGIGQGLPLALGAAASTTNRKTVLLSGDGGFVLNLGELWTAVQESLNIVMIVMNDGGYSVIKHIQDAQCAGNRQYGDLLAPDFRKLAASANLPFFRVREAAAFGDAVAQAMQVEGPSLVEVDMHVIGAHPPYFPYSALDSPSRA
jgi:acetolactate synthase-1/2/3 large subunit